MSSLIFCFWRATVLTFLKNGWKLLKDKSLEIIPKYGRTEAKVGLRVGERIIIFETLQLILALYFKMLSVVLSGLVLIRIVFEETYIYHLYAYLLACFYEKHLKYLTSQILFLLRRFRTVETIPFCKSRDNGADMRFRNS